MEPIPVLKNRSRPHTVVTGAILLTSLILVAACTADTSDVPRGMATSSPPGEVRASPTSAPDKTKSAEARCRKRAQKAKDQEFVPQTYKEGAHAVLPIVFPDGATAELVYPPKLKLAELGVQPTVSVGISKRRWPNERFLIITKTAASKFREKGLPIRTYEGPSGKVRLWRAKDPEEFLHPLFLHFRIGTWNVIVGDGNDGNFMGRRHRRLWAERLAGHETENGFVVIDPLPPLTISRGAGRPKLWFAECFQFVDLRLEKCRDLKDSALAKNQTATVADGVTVHRSRSGRTFNANWCTPSRRISVYVDDATKKIVDLAVAGLKVRNVDIGEDEAP